MKTSSWTLPLSVTLAAPWAIPGASGGALGLDVMLAREGGKPAIPAAHVKGVLRDACTTLATQLPELRLEGYTLNELTGLLFGRPDGNDGSRPDGLARGRLHFSTLVAHNPPAGDPSMRAVRVAIDPDLGAAREGHLMFLECPWPYGTQVSFSGRLTILAAEQRLARAAREFLERALRLTVSLGGMKSSGFGKIAAAGTGDLEAVKPAAIQLPASRRVRLTYTFDRPFLVNARRMGGNLAIGDTVVPGAVIKGALARMLAADPDAGDWEEALASCIIGHAFPQHDGENTPEYPLPLSLYLEKREDGSSKLFCALQRPPGDSGQVFFQPDWKGADRTRALRALGLARARPGYSGRTRTAIDSASSTALHDEDEGGALFSQIAINPEGYNWVGEMILPEAPELQKLFLTHLQTGCFGVGKTKATLRVENVEDVAEADEVRGSAVTLALKSDAVLLRPADLETGGLRTAYAQYFSDLGLELEDFYATQSLKGDYLALRYPEQPGMYTPWIVTEAGSVFQLAINTDAGRENLKSILQKGLPPKHDAGSDWRVFPFGRENGFGHVASDAAGPANLKQGVELS